MKIQPNDLVVLSHPGVMSEEVRARIRADCEKLFGTERVLVLEEGITLQGAIRGGAAEQLRTPL